MAYLVSGVLAVVATLLDCTLLPQWMPFGIYPSLLLAFAVSMGIIARPFCGAMLGLLAGVMMDMLFGPVKGFYALILMTVTYAASAGYRRFFAENPLFAGIFIAGAAAAREILSLIGALLMLSLIHI